MTDRQQTEKREIIKAENADSINRWNRLDKKIGQNDFFCRNAISKTFRKHEFSPKLF